MALSPQVLKKNSSMHQPPLSLDLAKLAIQLSAAAKLETDLRSLDKHAGAAPSSKVPGPLYVNLRDLELKSTTGSPFKRKRVDSMSKPNPKSSPLAKKQKADPSPQPPTPPPSETRKNVPQKYTLDQSRSMVFTKGQGQQSIGISVADLLRDPVDLYRGDELIRYTGGASVIFQWPGYIPVRIYVRFEHPPESPPEPSPYISHSASKLHTKTALKLRYREFAKIIATKMQSWLSNLTRQKFDKAAGTEWELNVECVPPLDEVVLVALGPVGVLDDGDEIWGVVLNRVQAQIPNR